MRKDIRISLWIIGGLFAFLIIAIISARLYFNDYRLKAIISDAIKNSTGSDVQIDSLKIDDWLQIKIVGLSLTDPEKSIKWMSLDSIRIKIVPYELLSKKLRINYVLIQGGYLDYGNIPKTLISESKSTTNTKTIKLPFRILMDSCIVNKFMVTGPYADITLGAAISKLNFANMKDFSFEYSIDGENGKIHIANDSIGVECNLNMSISGAISTAAESKMNADIVLSDTKIAVGTIYDIGDLKASLVSTINIADSSIKIDSMDISLNNNRLISGNGLIRMGDNSNANIALDPVVWDLGQFAGLIRQAGLPLELSGLISLDSGLINASRDNVGYQLALGLANLGLNYSDTVYVSGLDGSISVNGTNGTVSTSINSTVESVTYNVSPNKALRISKLSLDGNGGFNDGIITFDLNGKIEDFFGGDLTVNAILEKSRVNVNIAAKNLDLSNLSNRLMPNDNALVDGRIDLTTVLSGQRDSIAYKSDIDGRSLSIISGNDTLSFGDQKFDLSGNITFDKDRINTNANFALDSIFDGDFSVIYPLATSSEDSINAIFYINIDDSQLPAFFPKSLQQALGPMDISGFTKIRGDLTFAADSLIPVGTISVVVEPTDLLLEDYKILIRQFSGLSEINLAGSELTVESQDTIGVLYAENYSDISFENLPISAKLNLGTNSIWILNSFKALIPSLRVGIDCAGEFGSIKGTPFSNIKYTIKRDSPDTSALNSLISIYGGIIGDFETDQIGDTLNFGGQIVLDSLGIIAPMGISCTGISGKAPIYGTMNMGDSLFVKKSAVSLPPISIYRRDRMEIVSEGKFGNISIGSVHAPDVNINDISADLSFRDGILMMPLITGNILGGNFAGKSSFDISDINFMREIPNFDRLGYEMSLEMASLDFNQLVGSFGPQENSALFSADFSFKGRGLVAPGADYTLDGVFNITEMGPQVANRVLDVIDPQNQNPGVAQTRALLNKKFLKIIDLSYRPKSFSFKIEHGAAYPEIYMDQPFFAEAIPILRIPMPIRYGRIPIKTIIDNLKEAGWQ